MIPETEEKEEVFRKLQKTKGKTYTISLPKEWVKKMKLKRGTMLRILPENGSLSIIGPSTKIREAPRQAPILITSDSTPEIILRMIDSAYLVGYDEILIETEEIALEPSLRNQLITHFQTKLTGVTMVTDSSNKLELKVVSSFEELSMRFVLKKMWENIISLHRDAVKLLREVGRLDNRTLLQKAETIRLRDNLIDSLHLHGIRLLKAAVDDRRIRAKIGLATGRDCLGNRLIIKSMERVGDHAAKICRNIKFLKKRIESEILRKIQEMSEFSIQVFSNAMKSFFDYIDQRPSAFIKANGVMDDAAKISGLEDDIDNLLFAEEERPELSAKELSTIKIIVESIRRAAEYSSDIAEIVLNLTIIDIIEETRAERAQAT